MTGIQYVVDPKGKKTAVIIDLRKHGRLWEDIYDNYIFRARANEPRGIPRVGKETTPAQAACVNTL
ncbi:MAG: hypothetical protein HY033_02655 [Ignavibacteriae bacterium]|nr:hypothetical protein [Ignavibacteria bacterium]MBI3363788.1 hypothetical protein [Ignavibacteriota bacterium]